jgi:uncharacterized membrane protein
MAALAADLAVLLWGLVAGVFGALTAGRAILWVQALPGLVALCLVLFN